ncbi:MAG TPA: mechanosensitive ion channel protein MscS, partial [Algoriphagus sp.]|nr:mechanosensitive ion channel protein MscS [Algoriphagus sp.]
MQSEANNTKTAPVSNFIDWLEELLNISLINLGESKLTIGLLLTLIFSFIALFVISEWLRRL